MKTMETSLVIGGDATGARAAVVTTDEALARLNAGIDRAQTKFKSARSSADVFNRSLDQQEAQVKQLKAAYDPLFAAKMRQADAEQLLTKAVNSGAISNREYMATLDQVNAAHARQVARIGQVGSTLETSNMQVANMGAQFNDIGVMLAAGQSPLMLAIQQGTQINQLWGPGGIQKNLKMVKAGFLSMVSPMALLTIGTIAAAGALVQWGVSALAAKEDTDELSESIAAIEQEAQDALDRIRLMQTGARNINELNTKDEIEALRAEADRLDALTRDTGGGHAGRTARANIAALREEADLLEDKLQSAAELVETAERDEENARRALELEESRTQALINNNLAAIEGYEAGAKLLATMIEQNAIAEAAMRFGEDSAEVTQLRQEAERRAFEATLASMEVSAELKDQLLDAFLNGQAIANLNMSGGIGAAADEAYRLWSNLSAALNISPAVSARRTESGINSGAIPPWAQQDLPPSAADQAMERVLADRRRDARQPVKTPGGGTRAGGTRTGGGGAREAKAALRERERVIKDIERQMDRLAPSYERDIAALTEWRDESLAALDPAKAGYDAFAADVQTIFDARLAEAYREDLDRREDWAAGIERGLMDINEDMMTFADVAEDTLTEFFSRGEDMWSDFVSGRKVDTSDLIDFVLDQFARLQYQQMIQPGLEQAFSWATGAVADLIAPGSGGATNVGRSTAPVARSAITVGSALPTLARGAATSAASAAAPGPVSISIQNMGSTPVSGEVEEESDGRGGRRYKLVLADEVGAAMNMKGGGARRALTQGYGVQPARARR